MEEKKTDNVYNLNKQDIEDLIQFTTRSIFLPTEDNGNLLKFVPLLSVILEIIILIVVFIKIK